MNKKIELNIDKGNIEIELPEPDYVGQKLTIKCDGGGLGVIDNKCVDIPEGKGILLTAIDEREKIDDVPFLTFTLEEHSRIIKRS